jgi:hypothetical protein
MTGKPNNLENDPTKYTPRLTITEVGNRVPASLLDGELQRETRAVLEACQQLVDDKALSIRISALLSQLKG